MKPEHVEKVSVLRATLDLPVSGSYGVFGELAKLLWVRKLIRNEPRLQGHAKDGVLRFFSQ